MDPQSGSAARISERFKSSRLTWPSWLLKNYLFFRIPLFQPQRFLDAPYRQLAWIYTSWFMGIIIAAVAALYTDFTAMGDFLSFIYDL